MGKHKRVYESALKENNPKMNITPEMKITLRMKMTTEVKMSPRWSQKLRRTK